MPAQNIILLLYTSCLMYHHKRIYGLPSSWTVFIINACTFYITYTDMYGRFFFLFIKQKLEIELSCKDVKASLIIIVISSFVLNLFKV